MTREQLKAILPEGADDSAVTKILDALHAEIQPYKDAAKQAADDLAAKVAAIIGSKFRQERSVFVFVFGRICEYKTNV